jgi:cytochrome P450
MAVIAAPAEPGVDASSLDAIDLADPTLFHGDRHLALFARLRRDDPVHLQRNHPRVGSFWNVTRYQDILQVDLDNATYPSRDTFLLDDVDPNFTLPMFLAMEPPKHTAYRDSVRSFFTGENLDQLEPVIRARARAILDALPLGQAFDWVERVAIELTSQVLAVIFDFPLERRGQLIHWSDLATLDPHGPAMSWQERQAGLMECLQSFTALKSARGPGHHGNDLLTTLTTGPAARFLKPSEFLGNILMLIVAGNDTTRNSITGGVIALNRHPEQYARLRADPSLLQGAVAEIFRWQTPIAYMRRVAAVDVELCGKSIRAGDKVVIWYASGNQDEHMFEQPEAFQLDRKNLRKSLSFGYGIHRCLGARLADMQLRILWEEILPRFVVEQCGDAVPVASTFVKGYASLPVVLRAHR